MYKPFIHSTLIGFFIPFSIYANNISEIRINELIIPLVIILLVNLVFFLILRFLNKDNHAFMIILSLSWILFFQFNRLYPFFQAYGIRIRYLAPLLVLCFVFIAYRILKLKPNTLLQLTNIFLISSLIMFIYPSVFFVKGIFQEYNISAKTTDEFSDVKINPDFDSSKTNLPDIFFVILDGYGGKEVLTKYFDLDNKQFYNMLEERDFKIAHNSRSNYTSTVFSLASTFNMNYHDLLVEEYGEDFKSILPFKKSIFNSATFNILKQYNYNIVMITSSSHLNPGRDKGLIDEFVTYMQEDQYLLSLYSNTVLRFFDRFILELDADGKPWAPASIDWVFNKGLTYLNDKKQDFVFLHLLSPHEPYYFDETGGIVIENKYKRWNNFDGIFADYCRAYKNNLLGLNIKVQKFLDSLQIKSHDMPLIIFQGDHGPPEIEDSMLFREGITDLDYAMFRTSILNAFLLPAYMRDKVLNGMTPVNSFRLLLSIVTGNEIGFLDNKSYKSDYQNPFKFELLNPSIEHGKKIN